MAGERRIRERAQGTRGGPPRLRSSPPNSQRLGGAAKGLAAPPSLSASLRCPRESRARQGHSLHHGTRFRGQEKGRAHKKPTGITYGAQDAPYKGALITEAFAFPTVRAVPTLRLCPTLHCGNATLQALPPGACRVPRCGVVRCGVIPTHYYQVFSPGHLPGIRSPGVLPVGSAPVNSEVRPVPPVASPGGSADKVDRVPERAVKISAKRLSG